MKKTAFLAIIGLAVLAWSCQVQDFTGTDLDQTKITDFQTTYTGNISGTVLEMDSISYGTLSTAVGQRIDITFSLPLDDATVASGITFHTLLATANSVDGTYRWNSAITPSTTQIIHHPSGTTDLVFLFDFSNASTMSNVIEMRIDPTILTANNGASKLDLDSDTKAGESQDDMIVEYINITGGSPAITAAGTQVNPRRGWLGAFDLSIGSFPALGGSIWNWVYNRALLGTYKDSQNYKAIFDAMLVVEKFNHSTLVWDPVSYTSSYSTTTGVYAPNFSTAVTDGIYRYSFVNPGTVESLVNIAGFRQRASTNYDDDKKTVLKGTVTRGGPSNYDTPANSDVSVSTAKDNNDRNVQITLDFAGAYFDDLAGLDSATITSSSLKIWDLDKEAYIPWSSVKVMTTNPEGDPSAVQHNNQVVLSLSPSYTYQGNSFQIHISKEMTYASGQWLMGDWGNVDNLPLQCTILGSDGSTI